MSLGTHDENATMPAPDRKDAKSQLLGACKRLCPYIPDPNPAKIRNIYKFIDRMFGLLFRPLRDDEVLDPMDWIETRPYPRTRKEEHKKAWLAGEPEKPHRSKKFVKSETYPKYKFLRWIQPLDDWTKMFMGPIATEIDKQVFNLPCFIKKIPIKERVEYIKKRIDCSFAEYTQADVESMEAHLKQKRADWMLYALHLFVCSLSKGKRYMQIFEDIIRGCKKRKTVSESYCDNFVIKLLMALRSGMNETSFINSLESLITHFYILENEFGYKFEDLLSLLDDIRIEDPVKYATNLFPSKLLTEGDDKLAAEEPCNVITKEIYLEYGYMCAPRSDPSMYGTDFCTLVFSVSGVPITNILYTYVTSGWSDDSYLLTSQHRKKELMRAKGYSYLYQYTNCPVIHELGLYFLRVTRDINLERFFRVKNHLSQWEMDILYEAYMNERHVIHKPIDCPMDARIMVETLYGVTVDMQLNAEKELQNLTQIRPLNLFPPYVYPDDWLHYNVNYVVEIPKEDLQTRNYNELPPYPTYDNFGDQWWSDHMGQFRYHGAKITKRLF